MFFKNIKTVEFCHYHKVDFSQTHLKTLGKSFIKKEVALEMSREERKNMNM